jgi:hypothetical protein
MPRATALGEIRARHGHIFLGFDVSPCIYADNCAAGDVNIAQFSTLARDDTLKWEADAGVNAHCFFDHGLSMVGFSISHSSIT